MNNAVYYVLVIVAGYFCGCIESGYLVGKLCGMDLQNHRRLGRHGERARLRDGHRDRQHRAQPARERPKHASRARLAHDLLNT